MSNLWIYIAIGAYLLNAAVFVVDKYLLTVRVLRPFAYAFWIAILSSVVLLFPMFFDISIGNLIYFLISFASGSLFFVSVIFLYTAVKRADISIASTQVGVTTAIFTFIFSILILHKTFSFENILSITLLILGMLFLGSANGKTILKHALAAGLTMGLSYVLIKWTLDASDFISGIFWTRIGFIVSALLSLISKRARSEIVSSFKMAKASSRVIFVGNKSLSGIAFLLLYYAISLGNVAFVNSLLGFQFLFILIIALLLRNRLPAIGENLERNILIRKLVGIALVITGFLFMINPI